MAFLDSRSYDNIFGLDHAQIANVREGNFKQPISDTNLPLVNPVFPIVTTMVQSGSHSVCKLCTFLGSPVGMGAAIALVLVGGYFVFRRAQRR